MCSGSAVGMPTICVDISISFSFSCSRSHSRSRFRRSWDMASRSSFRLGCRASRAAGFVFIWLGCRAFKGGDLGGVPGFFRVGPSEKGRQIWKFPADSSEPAGQIQAGGLLPEEVVHLYVPSHDVF